MHRWLIVTAHAAFVIPLLCGHAPGARAQGGTVTVDQGWTADDTAGWYRTSQGSRLLPLRWALALERSDSPEKFFGPANMARYNYLRHDDPVDNPYNLPLGFVVDQDPKNLSSPPWVGLNCAACHTNEITYKGKTARIQGAPALADFQRFEEDLLASLKAARLTPEKWARFSDAVLREGATESAKAQLGANVGAQIAWLTKLLAKSESPVRYGFGRLDAQGHILNKVSLIVHAPGEQPVTIKADAPASYPFLWGVPEQKFVQWNGIAKNGPKLGPPDREYDLGALARNTGEVVGVFADVSVKKLGVFSLLEGYDSSVRVDALIDLERLLKTLAPPAWPAAMFGPEGEIDVALAAEGKRVFEDKTLTGGRTCAGCHKDPAGTMAPLAELKTDLWLACNTYLHESKAGEMTGQPILLDLFSLSFNRLEPVEKTRNILQNVIAEVVLGKKAEIVEKVKREFGTLTAPDAPQLPIAFAAGPPIEYLPGVDDPAKKARARTCLTERAEILRYKARPLKGIWATAPYLHNGSVPTLYDLLLPSPLRQVAAQGAGPGVAPPGAATRPDTFNVGTREFDPKRVGFVTTPSPDGFKFEVRDASGKPIPGNYNSGHDYGTTETELNDRERWALVEYMKTLQ